MLRIHEARLVIRNPEERRVKSVRILDERPESARIRQGPNVPEEVPDAASARTRLALGDCVTARLQELPEALQPLASGEPARYPHDRDRRTGRADVIRHHD